jgi:hypothetical protein
MTMTTIMLDACVCAHTSLTDCDLRVEVDVCEKKRERLMERGKEKRKNTDIGYALSVALG